MPSRAQIALQTCLTITIRLNDRSSFRQPVQPPGVILATSDRAEPEAAPIQLSLTMIHMEAVE